MFTSTAQQRIAGPGHRADRSLTTRQRNTSTTERIASAATGGQIGAEATPTNAMATPLRATRTADRGRNARTV